jgi:MYXO-CTERM domain-containing protein
MRDRLRLLGVVVLPLGLLFATPRVAHAGLEACGNINVSAQAKCEVKAQGGCTVQCEPIRFEAACSARLETSCRGQCNASADVSCEGSCTGSCKGQCDVDPGSLDCSANCKGTCEADCSGKCSASNNQGECQASCKATCGGSCDAQCTGTPPTATCEAKCQASCKGSCSGKANIDCQVQCQSSGYASCKAELEGGCKGKCTQPEGALFCDGQYVDTGNNLKNCIDALEAALHIEVSGKAECSGNQCNAEGTASASCATAPEGGPLHAGFLAAGLGVLGAALLRRRRRM